MLRIAWIAAVAAQPAQGAATSFGVPSQWANAESPGNNIFPFSTTSNFRLQQVYLGADMPCDSYTITGIAMRPDARHGLLGTGGRPKAFDLLIQLQTPFAFDPGLGNLLLEIRKFSPDIAAGIVDTANASDDSVGRVLSYSETGGSANSTTGSIDFGGAVTRFLVTTPEPAGAASMLAAFAALAAVARRPRPGNSLQDASERCAQSLR